MRWHDYLKIVLQWRHNGRDGVSNHQPHDCLLNRLFGRRSKKTSRLCVTGLCAGNSPVTGEFPPQMASNAEIVSIWWRHHECVGIEVKIMTNRAMWSTGPFIQDVCFPCLINAGCAIHPTPDQHRVVLTKVAANSYRLYDRVGLLEMAQLEATIPLLCGYPSAMSLGLAITYTHTPWCGAYCCVILNMLAFNS